MLYSNEGSNKPKENDSVKSTKHTSRTPRCRRAPHSLCVKQGQGGLTFLFLFFPEQTRTQDAQLQEQCWLFFGLCCPPFAFQNKCRKMAIQRASFLSLPFWESAHCTHFFSFLLLLSLRLSLSLLSFLSFLSFSLRLSPLLSLLSLSLFSIRFFSLLNQLPHHELGT